MYCDLQSKTLLADVLHCNGDIYEIAACRGKVGIESHVPVGLWESLFVGYEHSNGHNKNQIWIETVYIRCKSKAEFVKRIPLFH